MYAHTHIYPQSHPHLLPIFHVDTLYEVPMLYISAEYLCTYVHVHVHAYYVPSMARLTSTFTSVPASALAMRYLAS